MKRLPSLLALLFLSAPAWAQQKPVNDGVSNTLLLTEREGSYSGQGGGKATAEPGEPNVGGLPAKNTVWYRYSAPANGRLIVEIPDTQGLRAELRYPGNPATTIPLQTFADGTSNTVFPNTEKLSVNLDRGQQAYLVVDAAQPFDMSWRFVEVTNNHWQDAETLTGASGTIVRGNRGAISSSGQTGLGLSQPAIWFEWTAPASGNYQFDLVGSRQWDNTTFDGFSIHVFSSVSGQPGTLLASGSGSTLDNSTRVQLSFLAGQGCYIACTSGTGRPDSRIWLSWYPEGSAGTLAWAQEQHRVSEMDARADCRFFKLRGDGDGSVRFISEGVDGFAAASAGVDYSIPGGILNLPPGTRSSVAQFTILPNIEEESPEAFGVGFTDTTGGLGIQDGTSNTVIIGEESRSAECALAWRELRVREGQTAYVELRRQGGMDRQVAVGWRVQSATCLAGVDMQALSGTAYLQPGQMSASIAIPTYQDASFEGTESFSVELTAAPQLGSVTDGASNTVVIVEDDDFFVPRPGSYCGLLDTQGWGALVKCTVTGGGSASGTVDYMGASYRFSGLFDAYGQLVAHFARNNRPSIGLRLRFAEGWSRCNASLRDPEGDWSDGVIRFLPYNGKDAIAPQAGRYTLYCEGIGGGSVQAPAAITVTALTDGSVRFVGRTADDQPLTFSSRVAQSDPDGQSRGECAFMLPLYGKAGNFYGTCDLGLGTQHPGAQTQLGWMKPWRVKDAFHTALPFQNISCWAVRYTPPAKNQRVTQEFNTSLGDGSVRFLNSGTVIDGTSNTLLISETNGVRITEPDNPGKCSMTIDAKTGWFSGRIIPPGGTRHVNFYGTFFQGGYGFGRGLVPIGGRSGEVLVEAP
ncbi:MAG: hypothetical protein CJBNEKGG_00159 [Prosthecobacter sp.]|nr:hypothetical protein [Prosthecobacter sp.]